MKKGLKPAIPRPSARESLAAANTVAQEAGLPPAFLTPGLSQGQSSDRKDELVQVNIRVRWGLGNQLADRARAESTTQKVLICQALAKAGFEVQPEDLKLVTAPRRRGSS